MITVSTSCKNFTSRHENPGKHRHEAFQRLYAGIKQRQQVMAASKPGNVRCIQCGGRFSPVWDHLEGRWGFPEMADTGTCRQCGKLNHICQNLQTHLKKAGIPPKYQNCTFKNYHVTEKNYQCVVACTHYLHHHSPELPGLYLFGGCGTGKTHLVSAVARELILMGREVVFTCVPGLCFDIKKAFDRESKISEQNAVNAYISCEYLVLDDLGVEKPTEWVKKTLSYIIYERDNRFKPTIITSNLSLDDIAGQIDKRTASRIAGMSRVIRLQGPDWRLK